VLVLLFSDPKQGQLLRSRRPKRANNVAGLGLDESDSRAALQHHEEVDQFENLTLTDGSHVNVSGDAAAPDFPFRCCNVFDVSPCKSSRVDRGATAREVADMPHLHPTMSRLPARVAEKLC
jgi:hypothetical protein